MIPVRPLVLTILGLLPLTLTSPAYSQQPSASKPARTLSRKQAENDIVTRLAICRWATKPPVLDGKLDEPCWKEAAPITQFASYWTEPKVPRPGTRAYFVWDNEALYYGGTLTDHELRSYGTKRNDTLWDGDVFEMFFKPRVDQPPYYEFQANPRALIFEAFFSGKGGYPDISKAPILGNKAAVTLDGTLDHPGDRDQSWTVEGRIPWTAFEPTGGKPKPGDEWRFAICRYDHGPKGTQPILMSSAPLTKPSFHKHEDYGKLRFEGPRE